MKLIKKDGRIQEFEIDKIYTSIENASRAITDSSLNESDLKIIVNDIKGRINKVRKDETPTSSYEVIGVITNVLKENGFTEVLKAFIEH